MQVRLSLVLAIILLFQVHPQKLDATRLGGLYFSGNSRFTTSPPYKRIPLKTQEKSLFHVTKDKKLYPGERYSLGFEFCFYENTVSGEVFSLRADHYLISLFYSVSSTSTDATFELLLDGKKSGISFLMPKDLIYEGNKFTFSLKVDEVQGKLAATLFGSTKQTASNLIKQSNGIDLRFGREEKSGNCLPLILRNLSISSSNTLLHHWKFTELSGDIAYESEGGLDAKTENCEWLINKHFYWEPAISDEFREPSRYPRAFPAPEHLIAIDSGIYIYNLRNKTRTKINYARSDYKYFASNNIKENDSLVAFQSGYPDKPGILNFRTGFFIQEMDKFTPDGHYYGGQVILDPSDTTAYLFGGYGWYLFKNTLLRYNKQLQKWDTTLTKGEKPIPSTYYSLLKSIKNDSYFIFGGLGVESGRHEDGQHPVWDLFELDLKTLTWKKTWEWNNPENLLTSDYPVWTDRNQSAIYAIAGIYGKEKKRLYRLSLTDSSISLIGGEFPEPQKETSNYGLYIDYETNLLYLFNLALESKYSSHVYLKIRTPVLSEADRLELLESSTPFKIEKRNKILKYSAITLVSLGIPALFFFWFIRIRKKKRIESEAINNENGYDPKSKFISLFGGLTIVNDKSEKIDEAFSPKLAELFSIILYYSTINSEHGILLSRLEQILWVDIPPENVKNNRNVAFSKLRSLVTDSCKMTVVTENDSVKIILPAGMINEQRLITDLLNKELKSWSDSDLNKFLKIVSRGEYLADFHSDWATGIRTEMVSSVIKKSVEILNSFFEESDYETCVQIANIILVQDSLGEEILKFKLRSLNKLERVQEAKKEFTAFKRGFKRRYKEDYRQNFDEFTGSGNE